MERSSWYHVKNIVRQSWDHPSNRGRRLIATTNSIVWQVSKRLRPKPRDVPFFGFTLRCYPDSQSASNVIYFTERYDVDEMAFIDAYLRSGDGFIDVGANIGTYSLFARSIVGRDGFVEAFEPHPRAVARLRENIELNGLTNITAHGVAVGAAPGEVELLDGADVSNRVLVSNPQGRRTVAVPMVTLDDALTGRSYSMGKVDVEGFETAFFRGASARLAAADPPVWQLEMLDHQLKRAGTTRGELVGILSDHGYLLAEVDRSVADGVPLELRWCAPGARSAFNLWAIHRDAVDFVQERLGRPIREAVDPGDGATPSR